MEWNEGDRGWRGYARHFGNSKEWWPEIRPARVVKVNEDGSLRVHVEGTVPGHEGKRNPGAWTAWGLDPDSLHRTPEAALKQAKRVAADANAEAAEDAILND